MKRLAHQVWRKARVATLHPAAEGLPYREEQHLPRPLACLGALVAGGAIYGFGTAYSEEPPAHAGEIAALITAALLVTMLIIQVSIKVANRQLTFLVRPFYRRNIPLDEVAEWRERTEVPQGNLGPDSYVVRMRGGGLTRLGLAGLNTEPRHGVELVLRGGSNFFVSSAHPEQLLHAISAAKSQAVQA